jgi:heme A synthase
LKQVFLFLPGVFLLNFVGFAVAAILTDMILYRRAFETLPQDFPLQLGLIGFIGFLGIFMTWFGLGDIKNRKHFVIPASVIVTGAIFGVLVKATENFSDLAVRILEGSGDLIYLFPLVLIIPVLAKGIVDRKTEGASK